MQTENIILMVELGIINPRETDEFSFFAAWDALTKDPLVWARTRAVPRNPEFPAMIPLGATRTVVAAMPPAEKKALRDRVLAKLPVEKSNG
jgi:hypothetical protein